ncbi:MAG: HAMP domain-containing protein [Nitrospirae bacterium]|nr:HAMP domain-containing protein [Nitrospirota bacterium]
MSAKNSIRKLLIISLIILSITPVFLLSGILSWQSYFVQKIQVEDIQKKQSLLALDKISAYIHEQDIALGAAAKTYDLIEMDRKEQYRTLAKLLSVPGDHRHRDIYSSIALLDSKGKELAMVSRSLFLTDADLGERSKSDEFAIPFKSGETYYSPVYFDEQTGEPFLKISKPITDLRTTQVKGMLVAEIRMNYMWDVIADIHVGKSGSAYMLDRNGRVIAHPNPSIVLRGTFFKAPEQPGITTGISGTKVVLDAEKIQLGDQLFYIVTELPVKEALKYTYQSLTTTIILLILTLSCAIVLGYVLVRKIVRPIESLAGTAHAISQGDFAQKARRFRNDETGTLSDTFNAMTSKLVETINTLERQMTELKQAEEMITGQNEMLNNILNSLTHPFYVINADDYKIIMANSAAEFGALTGTATCYALTHRSEKPCEDIEHPCVIKQIRETGKPAIVEHIHYDKEGKMVIAEVHGYPVFDKTGNISQVIEYTIDITTRKKIEEQIKASLEEKVLLLREIHHRVKNNMQIISSILNLQSGYIKDTRTLAVLRESKNRIDVMALIHEKLYQSKSLARINFQEYIDELVTSLLISYGANTNLIRSEIHAEGISFEINTAIPCGLIINELVSNSLKHAFPDGRGNINIFLEAAGDGRYTLTIRDDGVGLPAGLDYQKSVTLGLKLVNALTGQLDGSIELDREMGTTFRITFREMRHKTTV